MRLQLLDLIGLGAQRCYGVKLVATSCDMCYTVCAGEWIGLMGGVTHKTVGQAAGEGLQGRQVILVAPQPLFANVL